MTSYSNPTSEPSTPASFAHELAAFIDADVSLGGEQVRPETDLVMTGLVDSLGVVLIVEWLEQRLGITIDPADVVIEHFDTVDNMVGYLRSRGDCSVD